jgi:glycosyltransferase involved in cell wall biosynthesis
MVRIPPRRGGAIESHVHDLYQILTERGVPVTLVSDTRAGSPLDGAFTVPVGSPIDRFPLTPAPSSAAHLVGGYLTARACARFLERDPDRESILLHMHEEVSATLLARTWPEIPKVFTIHNPPLVGSPRLGHVECALRRVGSAVTRRFVTRHADLVIAPNAALQEYLIDQWGLPADRVGLLPLPIDTSRYLPGRPENGHTELLYVGRLEVRKNVADLLRLMEGLTPEIHLTLVGDGPLRDPIRRAIERRQWQDRVRLFARVGPEWLLHLYRTSTAFVFPSGLESFGRVIVEAAACGLPVVLPELPVYQDFIDSGFAIPYSATDVPELREAVERLHLEDRWRQELGRRARQYVLLHNSYPVFARRLLGLYGQVAA